MARQKRLPHSTSAIWLATVFGTPLAAAWLHRRNRLASPMPAKGRGHEAALWIIGLATLGLLIITPPDLLSKLFSAGIFSYVAVSIWLLVAKPFEYAPGQARPEAASLWVAVGVVIITRILVAAGWQAFLLAANAVA